MQRNGRAIGHRHQGKLRLESQNLQKERASSTGGTTKGPSAIEPMLNCVTCLPVEITMSQPCPFQLNRKNFMRSFTSALGATPSLGKAEMAGSSADPMFQWGHKEVGIDSSYESMCYKGIWYNLHDCVFCKSVTKKPYIGKLMRLFEDEIGAKMVCIRWFFRPYELLVSVYKELPKGMDKTKELSIALHGSAKGVENKNVVQVVEGKANVLCTAKYPNNLMPSQQHVDDAHFFFNRAYDVVKQKLVKIANIENKALAQRFLNKQEWLLVGGNAQANDCKSSTLEEYRASVLEDCTKLILENSDTLDTKKRALSRTNSMTLIAIHLKKMNCWKLKEQ